MFEHRQAARKFDESIYYMNASLEFRAELIESIPRLRAYARSLTRNPEQADDLVHDAVVQALAAQAKFRPGTNLRAWIFTILRNLHFSERRKSRVRSLFLEESAAALPTVAASPEGSLAMCDFKRAFWRLRPEQREVLILVGASGLSYEEAADICKCAVGTVKSRVFRARQQLLRLYEGAECTNARVSGAVPIRRQAGTFPVPRRSLNRMQAATFETRLRATHHRPGKDVT